MPISPATSYLSGLQFYNAEDSKGVPVFRKAVEGAITLCYDIQAYPSGKKMSYLKDPQWLKNKMWSPDIWKEVRGHVYTTGVYQDITQQMIGEIQNEKPYVVAYSDSSTINGPLLLVAFPGMQMDELADFTTIAKFFPKSSMEMKTSGRNIKASAGFVDAAESAIANGLFQEIKRLLDLHNSNQPVQIVFAGHSLGGAVASLCALKYVEEHLGATNINKQVIVLTLGQPKTIKEGSEGAYNKIMGIDQYIRLVTIDKKGQTDCITGYRDATVDTVACCHAGTEMKVQTGASLVNKSGGIGKLAGKIRHWLLPTSYTSEEWIGFRERIELHSINAYWTAMKIHASRPFKLTGRFGQH